MKLRSDQLSFLVEFFLLLSSGFIVCFGIYCNSRSAELQSSVISSNMMIGELKYQRQLKLEESRLTSVGMTREGGLETVRRILAKSKIQESLFPGAVKQSALDSYITDRQFGFLLNHSTSVEEAKLVREAMLGSAGLLAELDALELSGGVRIEDFENRFSQCVDRIIENVSNAVGEEKAVGVRRAIMERDLHKAVERIAYDSSWGEAPLSRSSAHAIYNLLSTNVSGNRSAQEPSRIRLTDLNWEVVLSQARQLLTADQYKSLMAAKIAAEFDVKIENATGETSQIRLR